MTHITYHIVEHEDGWAYKLGDVFSERFVTRDDAMEAARRVAAEQRVPGESTIISYQCPPSAALRQIEWSRERRISGSS